MDILGKIEAYLPEGKVEFNIEDGEIYTEEDFDSLKEQGAFDHDDDDNDDDMHNPLTENMIKEMCNRYGATPKITQDLINCNKQRKAKRKQASKSRKINRSK